MAGVRERLRMCPLLSMGVLADHQAPVSQMPCAGEECAWWDDETGMCAFLSLATGINLMLRRGERKE